MDMDMASHGLSLPFAHLLALSFRDTAFGWMGRAAVWVSPMAKPPISPEMTSMATLGDNIHCQDSESQRGTQRGHCLAASVGNTWAQTLLSMAAGLPHSSRTLSLGA